ncbi:hypothetical protein F5Y12DRAFT_716894 [Xylaria sp. FL1777]|nr:hypothetical protein F5Y12DRAFT_716894 [Xylaria sp. FL1777]
MPQWIMVGMVILSWSRSQPTPAFMMVWALNRPLKAFTADVLGNDTKLSNTPYDLEIMIWISLIPDICSDNDKLRGPNWHFSKLRHNDRVWLGSTVMVIIE